MRQIKRRRLEARIAQTGTVEPDRVSDAEDEEEDIEFKQCPYCLQFHRASTNHQCKRLAEAKDSFFNMYRCNRCHDIFTPISNVGMWQCKYHPGYYTRDEGYSCCGQKRIFHNNPYVHNMIWSRHGSQEPSFIEPLGCTACDHVCYDAPETTNAPIEATMFTERETIAYFEPPFSERPGYANGRLYNSDILPNVVVPIELKGDDNTLKKVVFRRDQRMIRVLLKKKIVPKGSEFFVQRNADDLGGTEDMPPEATPRSLRLESGEKILVYPPEKEEEPVAVQPTGSPIYFSSNEIRRKFVDKMNSAETVSEKNKILDEFMSDLQANKIDDFMSRDEKIEFLKEFANKYQFNIIENDDLTLQLRYEDKAFKFGKKNQYSINDVNTEWGFWGTLKSKGFESRKIEDCMRSAMIWLTENYSFSDAGALLYLNGKYGRQIADQVDQPTVEDVINVLEDFTTNTQWKNLSEESNKSALKAQEDNLRRNRQRSSFKLPKIPSLKKSDEETPFSSEFSSSDSIPPEYNKDQHNRQVKAEEAVVYHINKEALLNKEELIENLEILREEDRRDLLGLLSEKEQQAWKNRNFPSSGGSGESDGEDAGESGGEDAGKDSGGEDAGKDSGGEDAGKSGGEDTGESGGGEDAGESGDGSNSGNNGNPSRFFDDNVSKALQKKAREALSNHIFNIEQLEQSKLTEYLNLLDEKERGTFLEDLSEKDREAWTNFLRGDTNNDNDISILAGQIDVNELDFGSSGSSDSDDF